MRGYFGIGVENIKTKHNIGTLLRSANIFDAQFLFTIGRRYKRQYSDVLNSSKSIPLYTYQDFNDFYQHLPYNCQLIGIELTNESQPIETFVHPERCIYLLGAEDSGLTKKALEKCHKKIQIPGKFCLNVAVAGSIIMYDRVMKQNLKQTG